MTALGAFPPKCSVLAGFRSPRPAHLHRKDLPQSEEEGVHIEVWVFAEAVGLGVVLEVHVVPPAGRGPLQKAAHEYESRVPLPPRQSFIDPSFREPLPSH